MFFLSKNKNPNINMDRKDTSMFNPHLEVCRLVEDVDYKSWINILAEIEL